MKVPEDNPLEKFIAFSKDINQAIFDHDNKIRMETAEYIRKQESDYWILACEEVLSHELA